MHRCFADAMLFRDLLPVNRLAFLHESIDSVLDPVLLWGRRLAASLCRTVATDTFYRWGIFPTCLASTGDRLVINTDAVRKLSIRPLRMRGKRPRRRLVCRDVVIRL